MMPLWNGGNHGYISKKRFYDIYSCFLSDNDQMVSFYIIAEGFDARLTECQWISIWIQSGSRNYVLIIIYVWRNNTERLPRLKILSLELEFPW